MRGFELVKREDHWALYNEDGHKIAATLPGCNSKLSIKNCQSIANGYDLDEIRKLADEDFECELGDGPTTNESINSMIKKSNANGAEWGFQKAMEILGDKKFSELDMRIAYDAGCNNIDADYNIDFQNTINSLQQTEWDVEIEMEYLPSLSYCNKCQKLINPLIPCIDETKSCDNWRPQLDTDGCLILKRI